MQQGRGVQGRPMLVSVGEVVWDLFPDRRVLGGAPVNVAYHLARLDVEARVVTRIGNDSLGRETMAQFAALGVDSLGVQVDPELATGQVSVTVGEGNEPRFDIVAPAAWDAIDLSTARKILPEHFDLLYGTLGQRDPRSRAAIRSLWEQATFRYYDVNLRPPFTSRELVEDSLGAADLVKLNDRELVVVGNWFACGDAAEEQTARGLLERFALSAVVVTEGAAGSWVVTQNACVRSPGVTVTVADTVGAGDAFFAAVIAGLTAGQAWPDILANANRRGAYVASQRGATPPMPNEFG